jgi:EAL and modified HD-GYP domain-containing signal transduction protein
VDKELIKACRHIRNLGYEIALDDYDLEPHWEPFLGFTSVVKIEVGAYPDGQLTSIVERLKEKRIKLVAEKVETKEDFDKYLEMGFDYFQGYFLAKPEIIRHRKLGGNKLAMLDLLTETGKASLDMDRITQIFERDPTLTFKLLRFINNPGFDKRNSISSLRHAINYMGQVELKKFIALLALANLNESQPSELLTMSLVRAKFCELMSRALNVSEDPPSGFLTGLLSLMDTITSQDMSSIMAKIPIEEAVKTALCGRAGLLRDCLRMVTAFEHGEWRLVRDISQKHKLKQTMLHSFYMEAVKWSNVLQNTDMS